jgi:protease I
VDGSVDDLYPEVYDALVIPGGYAPDHMRRNDKLLSITRAIAEAGKPVAFICHAAWVPISAGLLRGRKATCVRAIRDDVVNAGATYLDEPVVVDRNLISSRTPADLPAFCRAIIQALAAPAPD